MKYFIILAKLLMLVVWGILLINLFIPFPGKMALVLYLLLGFTFFMHLLQLLVVYGAFAKELKLSKSEIGQIFIFGVFKLWEIKKRLL